jgi:glycosyltransferase involved in cell wall biosynthesis
LNIGYFGATTRIWGFNALVTAIATLRKSITQLKVLVVGAHDREACRIVRQHGLQEIFHFVGHMAPEQMPKLVSGVDLGVSLRQKKTLGLELSDFCQPLKVLEFMSCGVVVTPLGEQSRLVKEARCGIVARGFTGDDIACAIAEVWARRDQLFEMSVNGRRYACAHHGWPSVIRKIFHAYADIEPSVRIPR